ncbi:MAG: HEAT repeat domain-containing protein [Vicinamibacteria bacterium]
MILESVVLSLTLGAAAFTLRSKLEAARVRARGWEEAARECGVAGIRTSRTLGLPVAVDGHKGALTVRLTSYGDMTRYAGTRMTISGLPTTLALGPPPVSLLGQGLPTRGIPTGDAELDAAVEVSGDALTAHAVFDAPTRRLTRELFGLRSSSVGTERVLWPETTLRAGTLARTHPGDGLAWSGAGLRDLLALAERIAGVRDLEASVAAVAAADPVADVRRACLAALEEERPRHPATRAALLCGLEDQDERIQLTAALALGSSGRAVLLDIARSERSSDASASRAVAELRAHLPAPDAERALAVALWDGKEATVAACLESLARRGEPHLPAIARVLRLEQGSLATAAARALGYVRAHEAETLLVPALEYADADVRLEAAASLGRVGTAAAVPALREAEVAHARDDTFTRTARQAVASIQARLSGAGQGQLALAAEGGEVSLADDTSGRLELPPGPVGDTDDRESR